MSLDVAGDIGMDEYLYHNGDADTYLRFGANLTNLVAGGWSAIKLDKSTNKIQLNNSNQDLDVQIMAEDDEVILHTDAGTNKVGIGTTAPNEVLTVSGNISALGSLSAGLGSQIAACNSAAGGFISGGRDLADIFATSAGNVDGSGTAQVIGAHIGRIVDTLTDSLTKRWYRCNKNNRYLKRCHSCL